MQQAAGPGQGLTRLTAATRLPAAGWRERQRRHQEAVAHRTAAYLARRSAGRSHPVDDFLFDYYGIRPARLGRWHPGVGTALEPDGRPVEQASWRWYGTDPDGSVTLDVGAYLADRGDAVRFVRSLLEGIASRRPFAGCFGLHEWAMVYREQEHRHPLPLRLGRRGTDAVLEQLPVRCSHVDAFRFFTPAARPLNRLRPTRATQPDLDQPGCLHAAMDCLKWALKLAPVVAGELTVRCFDLAAEARQLDMRASPYDVSGLGLSAVAVETPEGRAEYVEGQRLIAEASEPVRAALLAVCCRALGDASPAQA